MGAENQLDPLRKKIDDLDTHLMQLINERANVAKQIGMIKQQNNLSVLQENREELVLDHIRALAQEISPNSAAIIWKEIMSACRQVQGENLKIGYLGPEGTFTQEAALVFFPKASSEFVPLERKYEIFQAVEKDSLNFGIVPVENSLQGSVSETLDLLIESNTQIYGEIEIRIIHNLIGFAGTKLSDIKTLYSHPIALPQVRSWIKKNIPQVEMIETSSTAKAVKKVMESNDHTCAAIGTTLAAEIYGGSLLAESIEDNTANYTRFVIISKKAAPKSGNDKTSMVFVTKHTPGALFNILQFFSEAKINLAKIESRPRKVGKDSLWEYIFILDFDDHVENVPEVLEKVRENAIWMKILGSYPRKPRQVE